MKSDYRLGIDAGGTFTDFVLADKTGQVRLFKALSTPQDPTLAIRNGLQLISDDLGVSAEQVVSNCDLCINGTTVGLNALITHKGAKTGLICTAGHEDSLEIRLGHKEDGYRYDPEYPPATMLVPRYLRRGIRERILSDGSIRTPLNEADVRAACEVFIAEGVETVAISFVWSVLHPEHEARAGAIVREMMPEVILTLGSELYPQVREYTRTSTAVVNAYLAPIMKRYVSAVDSYFGSLGAKQPVRYYQSNGGLAIGQAMTDRSVYAINSGPASAPAAGQYVCEPFGYKNVITVDMGGTSFDITLTKDGSTNINKNIDFLRYRIGVPMIQVETLGAGGGSIGWIDEMGLMQMGPQSAGSDPGPACYGQGGKLPTVSDANLVLGYLNPDGLVGGRLPLDYQKAHDAIKTNLADPLKMSVERAAYGMFTIVNANMVNGIRRVTVERGYDPRDFVLVGAGGATAAHITALADAIGIDTIVLPKLASGLCAFGQIISDVKYNYMATAPLRLDNDAAFSRIDALFNQIEAQGVAHLKTDGFKAKDIVVKRSLDMRYVGQVHECTVEIGNFKVDAKSIAKIKNAFHKRHKELYTYAEPQSVVEVVNIESTVYGVVDKPERMTIGKGATDQKAVKGHRDAVFSADGKRVRTPIYDGTPLGVGASIKGPAVIEEVTTTIVLEPGWTARLDASGSYLITRERKKGGDMSDLSAAKLSVAFAGLRALSEVDLKVTSGQIVGLIGPNGAGKTTLVNVMTGFQPATSGAVSLDGQNLSGLKPHELRRRGVARTFQGGRLFRDLAVIDNLEVTGVGLGLSRAAAIAEAEAMLDWVGIAPLANRIAGALPYTDERRVAIGRALMGKPAFVLLDEPAAGMSATEAQDLSTLIRRVAGEMGCGVLLIEHNVGLVLDLCDHVVVLDSGVVIEAGDPATIRASEKVRHAYMGTAADTNLPVLEVME